MGMGRTRGSGREFPTKGPCEHGVKYRSKCKVCSACPHGKWRSRCRSAVGLKSAITVVTPVQGVCLRARPWRYKCKECGGGSPASTVVYALSARSAVGGTSTVVGALGARSGGLSASTVVSALRQGVWRVSNCSTAQRSQCKECGGSEPGSTVVTANTARRRHQSASTVVYALHVRSGWAHLRARSRRSVKECAQHRERK